MINPKVPKNIYFIHYDNVTSGKPQNFLFVNYLCIKSAIIQNPKYKVYLITNNKDILNDYADIKKKVKLIIEKPISKIFGHKLVLVQHSSDIRRIRLLYDLGGIYMDTDEFCVKPFDSLDIQDYDVVAGNINKKQIGIGLIIAVPKCKIFRTWLYKYKNFQGNNFQGYENKKHTVNIKKFAKENRTEQLNFYLGDSVGTFTTLVENERKLKILRLHKKITYFPSTFWLDLKDFFDNPKMDYPDSIVHHLWQSLTRKFIDPLTIEDLNKNAYFYRKAKEVYEHAI